jgi:hypothetical protein
LVATSKSFGVIPKSKSRTAPPTRNPWYPASLSRYSTLRALGEIADRDIECSERGMIKGANGFDDAFKKRSSA